MTDNGEKTYLREQNKFFKWATPSMLVLIFTLLGFIWNAQVDAMDKFDRRQQQILEAQHQTNQQLSAIIVNVQSNRRDIDRHERKLP